MNATTSTPNATQLAGTRLSRLLDLRTGAYVIRSSVRHTQSYDGLVVESVPGGGVVQPTKLPGALGRLWAEHDEAAGEQAAPPGLSRSRIVTTAVAIADAEGLPALSMARLAAELGSAPMSLYRHVANKDELLEFMVAAASAELPERRVEEWRTALRTWAHDLLRVYRRHPWILTVSLPRPPLDPYQLAWLDRGLAALAELDLSAGDRLAAVFTVVAYVRGQAGVQFALAGTDRDAGLPAPYLEVLSGLMASDRFPALRAAVHAGAFSDPADSLDLEDSDDPGPQVRPSHDLGWGIEIGLDLIVDGLRARLPRS
jgi:AcrR family transcriptional regulator